jgi:hypothetical protein
MYILCINLYLLIDLGKNKKIKHKNINVSQVNKGDEKMLFI